jgi:hypothetical protein
MEHAFLRQQRLIQLHVCVGEKKSTSNRSSGVNTYLSSGGIIFHYFVFTAEWWAGVRTLLARMFS